MTMLVVNKYVNVLNPARVEAVILFRSYDEAEESWGSLSKTHITPFGPVNEGNLIAARSYVSLFQIGEKE